MSSHRSPAGVRSSVKHPIIDADGHWVEYNPVFAERMRKVAGDKAADGFIAAQKRIPEALNLSIAERQRRGIPMEGYWGRQSTNTRDRATAMMPRLLYDRLDELGIDFGVIYPTAGLGIPRIVDDETRRAVIRGFNIVTAEYFAKLSDRLTPAAVIRCGRPTRRSPSSNSVPASSGPRSECSAAALPAALRSPGISIRRSGASP